MTNSRSLRFEKLEDRQLLAVWAVSPVEDILPVINALNEAHVQVANERTIFQDTDGDERITMDDVFRALGLPVELIAEGEPGDPTGLVGLGVAGDSLSDEYAGSYGVARNWVELLVEETDIYVGPHGSWGEPRGVGYEFNWAKSGATSASLLSGGQDVGLAGQIATGEVGYAVVAIGQNDFQPVPFSSAYAAIYNDNWTDQQVAEYTDDVFDNIETAVQTIHSDQVDLVLSNVIDYGVASLAKTFFPDPLKRERVTVVIESLNTRLTTLAREHGITLVDNFTFAKDFFGTNQAPIDSQTIGGVTITNTAGSAPTNAFYDGVHPHTLLQAGMANVYLTAFNIGYDAGFDLFSEQQMVTMAGLTYGGQDTFGVDYVDYVVPPNAMWQNPQEPLDVDGNTYIVPLDVLNIINELNDPQYTDAEGRLPLPPPPDVLPPYFDVNGDRFCTPIDALAIVNFLNGGERGTGSL
ncbi:MAG: GDSL-type esterase/lipase family protein [Pirellulaceae bacterium]